ncbi:MAG TPA: adenylate/guanylate cyclase domain-containing protein [Thermodesulfobacteriota bacterium]|nr:adenylate/guanylate cyclase domain-containing protein [Thermodesulfobacteriota bacterium]
MKFPTLSTRARKIMLGAVIGAIAWLVTLILYYSGVLESYELQSYDQLCRMKALNSPAPRDVVLIAVDQGSLEAAKGQGITWPWPRQMYAPLLDFCAASGARAVVFDILFTDPSPYGVEDDQLFAEALKKNGKAVLGLFLTRQSRPSPGWEKDLLPKIALRLDDKSGFTLLPLQGSVLPLQPLAEGAGGLGNVAAFPDQDGIYRRIPIVFPYRDYWIPALGLAPFRDETLKDPAVLSNGVLSLKGERAPVNAQANFLLHFYRSDSDFARYSAFNVIQSALALQEGKKPVYPPDLFRDKIVFVGYTAPGLFDLKPNPVSSRVPGMVMHATLAANILHRDFRVRIPPAAALALAFLLAAAVSVSIMLIPNLWLIAAAVGGYASLILLAVAFLFSRDIWVDGALLAFSSAIAFAMSTAFSYATEGRQRRQIKDMFSRYMSDLLIQDLLKNPEKLRLGGERRTLSVYFSDLAGFTSLSERLAPEEVVSLLNRYLTAMTEIILASGGIIDKYEGDAIMAFWGAPVPQEDHAARACLAALDCQARLASLRREFVEKNLPAVFSRIGVNTGEMIIGNMGSNQRFDFTVIGDNVNLASRLEGASKEYGTSVIISEETFRRARDLVEARELDLLQVKGKEIPVRIYELIGRKGEVDSDKRETLALFAEALALYRGQRWDEAVALFERILARSPEDGPSKTFLQRSRYFKQNPPEPGWIGVYRLTTK